MLEWIAMSTMLIDHIGLIFFPDQAWIRVIGRMAFPIYCWGIVRGYHHTRDVQKYMSRLLFLALLSQIPYLLAFQLVKLNAIFTLLLGLFAIYVMDHMKENRSIYLLLIAFISLAVPMDYGLYGVLLIAIYHKWWGKRAILAHLLLNAAYFFLFGWVTQLFSVAATILLILIPSWTKYRLSGGTRWFYRIFYPVHLLALFLFHFY